jgi:hypothetical protein
MEQRALLADIVTDFEELAASYRRARFLGSGDGGHMARSLLGGRDEVLAFRRLFLLVDALLRNVVGKQLCSSAQSCKHVTVFGGTQVGKSTCLNVILGANVARVHHTAGFTRHVQGFVPPGTRLERLFGGNPLTLRGFTPVPCDALQQDNLDVYCVQQLPSESQLPHCALWDAPDCDSVDASQYMAALVEALTLADVVVYVTSREKYAVEHILAWVVIFAEAGVPLVGCLNMTPRSQQEDILASHQQALATVAKRLQRPVPDMDMVAFPLVDAATSDEVCAILCDPRVAPAHALRQHISRLVLSSQQQATRVEQAIHFITSHLPTLLEPAQAELDAIAQWETVVADGLERFVQDYRKHYLDNPQRYDAFARVSVEILSLLNPPIPGLQEAIRTVRVILSLPARLIMFIARKAWQLTWGGATVANQDTIVPAEVQTYTEAHTRFLHGLAWLIQEQRAKSRHHPFWDELDVRWEAHMHTIQAEFDAQLTRHWQQTEQRIKDTAAAIFHELEKRPAVLNSLRASRLVGDAAAIVVSVQMGGAGDILHDILLAPAMLAVLEAISRAITEGYVTHRRLELRDALLQDNRHFVNQVYNPLLLRLSEDSTQKAGFLHLDAEVIKRLPVRLAALRASLDIQQGDHPGDG